MSAPAPAPAAAPAAKPITLTILGTNDLHGALDRLPLLAGFIANVRAARAADGGGVVLVDGGDMFQGTLESNLSEGADVVRAYNQIGYTAVAFGNHEFDYGPVGPHAVASGDEDPRGALKARVSEAKFPFVVSNIADAATGAHLAWPNVVPSLVVEVAGVKVGVIGATTEATPHTTMPANFAGLQMTPTAQAITEQAAALRGKGAQVIVATMHIGAACKSFDNPDDSSSCDKNDELFRLLAALPKGTVDVIVGGHTHAGIAHRLEGVAVIESFASGRAFGRVDLQIGPDGKVAGVHIDKPHWMCEVDKDGTPVPVSACAPGDYEGKPVVADPAVQRIVDEAVAKAAERRKEKLGVTVSQIIKRAWAVESAEGNLFCDLMLAARPDAQVALTNGGGLRADIPAGELTYGQLFEAIPFDNRFAIVEVTGDELQRLVTTNLRRGGAILSWGGLAARARCAGDKLDVRIRVAGKPLDPKRRYKIVTSDFLASGGNGVFPPLKLPEKATQVTETIIREAFRDVLRGWKGKATLDPAKLYAPTARRLDYEGTRPLACGSEEPSKEKEQ
ncbi:MAG TPA: 5'-nucleotidase C-terminal domain-containing protein [Kofleriaceae bacterium]|nr:5'-nucleotidase C-terminal domain-containing protein [Kofleriaceae bacterium]